MKMQMILGVLLGGGAVAVASDDPTVQLLEEELLRTLPAIGETQKQMAAIVGEPVGVHGLLLALFIVFCGRQFMVLLAKAIDVWADERKAGREVATSSRAEERGEVS
jgi:hypothetical protein